MVKNRINTLRFLNDLTRNTINFTEKLFFYMRNAINFTNDVTGKYRKTQVTQLIL